MLRSAIAVLLVGVALSAPYGVPTNAPVMSGNMPYAYGPRHATSPSTWDGGSTPVVTTPCLGNGAVVPTQASQPSSFYAAPQHTYGAVSAASSYVTPTKTPCPYSPRPHHIVIETTAPATVPVVVHTVPASPPTTAPAPVSAPGSPSPSMQLPSPRPGSAAMAEDGSMVTAEGDNTVSAAADKNSGAASSNGDDASFAAAAPGAALGLGTSLRAHTDVAPTPCTKSKPVATSQGATTYKAPVTAPSQPYRVQPSPCSLYTNGGVNAGRMASPSPTNAYRYKTGQQGYVAATNTKPSTSPKRDVGYNSGNNAYSADASGTYVTKTPCPYSSAPRSPGNRYTTVATTVAPVVTAPVHSHGGMQGPALAPSSWSTPHTNVAPVPTPSSSPAIVPSPVPGSMAQSQDGSTVTAEGDNTVSIAADKDSGSAAANGEDASLAAAAPGLGVAIGTSTRSHA